MSTLRGIIHLCLCHPGSVVLVLRLLDNCVQRVLCCHRLGCCRLEASGLERFRTSPEQLGISPCRSRGQGRVSLMPLVDRPRPPSILASSHPPPPHAPPPALKFSSKSRGRRGSSPILPLRDDSLWRIPDGSPECTPAGEGAGGADPSSPGFCPPIGKALKSVQACSRIATSY